MSDFEVRINRQELKVRLEGPRALQSKLEIRNLRVKVSGGQLPAANQGPERLMLTAMQPVSALRAVKAVAGGIEYASSADNGLGPALGITASSAPFGALAEVQTAGELSDSSWNWIPSRRIFLGLDGALAQAPSLTGQHVSVGVAISPTQMLIRIEDGLKLEV